MSAIPSGLDAPLVCLCDGNPNRLVSLWDVVNQFKIFDFCGLLVRLQHMESALGEREPSEPVSESEHLVEERERRGTDVPQRIREALAELKRIAAKFSADGQALVKDVETFCESVDFDNAFTVARLSGWHFKATLDQTTIRTEIKHVKEALILEAANRRYLQVDLDRCEYLEQDELFGGAVNEAFPSAARDIKEAGNCLAAECGTAAVFHLMRAAEFALHALARDRDVEFKDRPLSDKQWGEILGALDGKLTGLRNANRKNWALPEVRDAQIRFYNEVVQELRGFNDAWRRHASHADVLAFYECDDALGILKHVRTFMQKLSLKMISENAATAPYWT